MTYENNLLQDVLSKEHAARLPLVLPNHSSERLQYVDRPLLNWGLVFAPKHVLLLKTIENIVENANFFRGKKFIHMRDPIIELTGPIMLTRTYYQCLEGGLDVAATQCGIDFDGLGNPRMKGGWVRFITSKSYVTKKNTNIL